MWRLSQPALTVGLILAAGAAGQTQEFADADVENGQAIAVGTFEPSPGGACFRCHGMEGAGDGAAGFPRLTDQAYEYMVESLREYASGERPNQIMQPIAAALSEQEMRDVSAYYASLEDAPYPPQTDVEPDVVQQGAILSAIGAPEEGIQACVNCHGPEGIGLPPTYPFIGGQHATYLRQQLELFRQGERQGQNGIMVYIARQMTDEQLEAAVQYFASLRPEGVTPEGESRPVTGAAPPPGIAPIPEDIPGVD
ncbi:c-type cytochrome [Chelativorans sp. YIM 93263]|uniref:c-type cytochrome n=1 Tax=Chelativorans sp. YIM 93263 TaxID=2906648 RepID=UPI00237843AE|nr:c-type cytochrome [Chelativorans sp. YIM 93263]